MIISLMHLHFLADAAVTNNNYFNIFYFFVIRWATAANSSKAMLHLSKPIAASPSRKIIHR